MSRASVAVLFPDGEVKFAIYNGTSDVLMPKLFDTNKEPWAAYYSNADLSVPENVPHESGEPVIIYCDYGDGSTWHGTATRDYVTSECDFMEIDDYSDCNWVLPDWVVWR